MSQSIDFRINDFINEYLDYKGFNDTVESFLKERRVRQEPIHVLTNGDRHQGNDQEQYGTIKVCQFSCSSIRFPFECFFQVEMLKNLDDGNRAEFLRLWSQHVPSTVIDSDPSLKSLEFLIYAHFAIYYLRPNNPNKVDFIDDTKRNI